MTLTIELTPEQEEALRAQAAAAGIDIQEYAKDLITRRLPLPPMTPLQAVQYWQREGLIGSYGDPHLDSQEQARRLRETVWSSTERSASSVEPEQQSIPDLTKQPARHSTKRGLRRKDAA